MSADGKDVQSPVTVSLKELVAENVSFPSLLEAFGPESLGIIIVNDLPPEFIELRKGLLSYSSYLANLPAAQLAQLENAPSKYLVGWSLGKETLKSGQYDTCKGSYYVNCAFYRDPALQGAPSENYPSFPEYTAPNVWPNEDVLPGFRTTLERLCTLIIDVAVLVADACDKYALAHVEGYHKGYLKEVVKSSMTTKARLLHYFPPDDRKPDGDVTGDESNQDDWCATHLDHGCLTGLTSAMFVDESANPPEMPKSGIPAALNEMQSSPDPKAGLYIHSRTGKITKVSIPKDCLAFQTGEALEVITQGKFKAVPHFVRGPAARGGQRVARNTLAVFTQPNLWEIVDKENGLDFAGFARAIVERNH